MIKKTNSELNLLLKSISSELSYNILSLFNDKINGLTLTATARELNEPISTVQEYLKKLLESNLVFKTAKKYYLSNFGSFFLSELKKFEIFNKFANIFGKIPAEMIPSKFIHELIPHIMNVEIKEDSWCLWSNLTDFINEMKKDMEGYQFNVETLQVLGWWNIEFDFQVTKDIFNGIELTPEKLREMFNSLKLQMVTHKKIVDEIKANEISRQMLNIDKFKESVRIFEDVEEFNFCLIRYNNIIGFIIIENEDIDAKHHLFIENNKGVLEVFEKLFNFYWQQSKPISRLV